MNALGIDLGKHGGLVLLAGDGTVRCWTRTPLSGKEYDGRGMAAALRGVLDRCSGQEIRAFVEAPATFNQRTPQALVTGIGVGRWMQALDMLNVPYQFVYAQTWVPVFAPRPKRARGKDAPAETLEQKKARRQRDHKDSKERLMVAARWLQPTAVPWDSLNKVDRSGIADALLLAEYGRRYIVHSATGADH